MGPKTPLTPDRADVVGPTDVRLAIDHEER